MIPRPEMIPTGKGQWHGFWLLGFLKKIFFLSLFFFFHQLKDELNKITEKIYWQRKQEPMSRNMQLNYIPKSNLLCVRLPWECHDQSRHCVTGPELPFFHKRKGVLKIDQSVKMP